MKYYNMNAELHVLKNALKLSQFIVPKRSKL